MGALVVLSLLYGVAGIVYLCVGVYWILKKNTLKVFDLVRLMYSFVFGFMPCILYWNEASGANILFFSKNGSISNNEIGLLYINLLFSIVAYFLINLSYYTCHHKNTGFGVNNAISYTESDKKKIKVLFIAGCISLAVGWISIVLWTSAYGSIDVFIQNASRIRSGRGTIYNPFAFMKHFSRIVQIALYALFSAYLYEKPRGIRRLVYWLLLLVALIGNYIFFVSSDSRITIMYVGLSLLIIVIRHKQNLNIRRLILPTLLSVSILLIAVMNADTFTNYIRNGVWVSKGAGFIQSLVREFSFTVTSEMKAMNAWQGGTLEIKFIDDIINSIASWIPERFIPVEVPSTVWEYNTELFIRMGNGTTPSDFLATSVYEFGLLGIIVWPILYGTFVGKIDQKLWRSDSIVYTDVCYGLFSMNMIMQISHCQISTFVQGLFPLFLYWIIVWSLTHINAKKRYD